VNHHFDRVVGAYRPGVILLYAGDNDVVEGKTAPDVAADFAEFRRLVRERVPEARCAFLAIKPSPKRVSALEVQREANALVAAQVRGDRQWTVLDTFTPLLGADGRPDASLFKDDRLHLNAEGYRRWVRVIRPWLEEGKAGH
jgi:lysophospholipase L1-like esterase